MLDLMIPEKEFWDEANSVFVNSKPQRLQLEHSLVSLAKWESTWCVPFLAKDAKTNEQTLDYIRCMTVTQNVKPEVYENLPPEIIVQIKNYIDSPMTATWFNERPGGAKSKEVTTAEIIYYWMIVHNIPMECQKWHLNRLLTLIRVCGIKSSKPKKMGKKEMLANREALNRSRLTQLNTKG